MFGHAFITAQNKTVVPCENKLQTRKRKALINLLLHVKKNNIPMK